jgi:hypothetical protein
VSVGDDLATTLRVVDGAAHFVVTTSDLVCQERIVHMGWQPAGDNSYVRKLSANGDLTRIHENFRRHLKEMVRQSAGLAPVPWDIALAEFLGRVSGTGLDWWLYGSAALAVRGVEIVPGDLDVAVDDAHHTGRILHDLLVEPVTGPLDWVATWIGRAFHGALVEWSAQAAPAVESAPNEFGRWAADRLETIVWRGHAVRVPRLDVQLAVAVQRGLTDRAAMITQLMAS